MDGESKLSYTNFDNLQAFPKNQNYLKLMRDISNGIIENKHLQNQIHYITELRRIKKFHQDLFSVTFNNILHNFIENLMGSSDPEVVYNSLILVTEIFSFYEFQDINIWVPNLLTKVIELSVTEKNEFLLKQSLLALYNLANNMFYEETLVTLLRLMKNKSIQIIKNAIETLQTFIYFIDYLTLTNVFDWQESFNIILELANSSAKQDVENVKSIITYIRRKMDDLEFNEFLQNYLNEHNQKIILGLLKERINMEDRLKIRINDENKINKSGYKI
jgi:hypothetical protein